MTLPISVPGTLWTPDLEPDPGESIAEFIKSEVKPKLDTEAARLLPLKKWMEGYQDTDQKVQGRVAEKRVLLRLARAPWLQLSVSMFSQALFVDGYKSEGSRTNADVWDTWVLNNFEAQQIAIHRNVVGLGYCYARALPGTGPDGSDKAVLRAVSPRRSYALFEDPISDAYPKWFLEVLPDNKTLRWYDNERYRDFVPDEKAKSGLRLVDEVGHGANVCPVVRYVNRLTLDGEPCGDVEPVISLAAKIDKTAYDRLLSQHFNSWRVRWATGIEQEDGLTDEELDEEKEKLGQESMLVSSDPMAKFGNLEQTDLQGFITAQEADVKDLFTVLQLPADIAGGQIINVGPDALAAARKGFSQKVFEKQRSIGISHARLLRLAAFIEGDETAAADYKAKVHWQDTDIRSLAQAADAWGKIVTMLKVPAWGAWSHLPDVDPEEMDSWVKWIETEANLNNPFSKYLQEPVKVPAGNNQQPGNPKDANATDSTSNTQQPGQNPGN